MSSVKKNQKQFTLILRLKTKSNCQCTVNSWVGGPTPSLLPSAGSLHDQLRLHASPFRTIDHPQTADPALAFGKMAGDTPSATKVTAHLTKYTWSFVHISQFPSHTSKLMFKHIWCVRRGEHHEHFTKNLLLQSTDLRKHKSFTPNRQCVFVGEYLYFNRSSLSNT